MCPYQSKGYGILACVPSLPKQRLEYILACVPTKAKVNMCPNQCKGYRVSWHVSLPKQRLGYPGMYHNQNLYFKLFKMAQRSTDRQSLCINALISGTFCVQVEEVELKPNGKDIPVTEMNKKEYVEYMECVLCVGISFSHPPYTGL